MLTVTERLGDVFISWVPMYSEAKLAFYIYLWYPKTRGTTYVYDSFFKPYMAKHETEIDRSLLELRTRAGDMTVIYWQRAASYAQTRIFDVLQFVASQSTVRRPPSQQDQSLPRTTSGTSRSNLNAQIEPEEPLSPTSSTSSSHHSEDAADIAAPAPKVPQSAPNSPKPKLITKSHVAINPPVSETNAKAASLSKQDAKAMEIEQTAAIPTDHSNAPVKDTVMDETLRVTRARLRKNRSHTGTAK